MFNVRQAQSKVPGAEHHYGDYINSFNYEYDAVEFANRQIEPVVVIRGNLCEVHRNKAAMALVEV